MQGTWWYKAILGRGGGSVNICDFKKFLFWLFVLFLGTGDWTWDFHQVANCPGWVQTFDSLASDPQSAGLTAVCHYIWLVHVFNQIWTEEWSLNPGRNRVSAFICHITIKIPLHKAFYLLVMLAIGCDNPFCVYFSSAWEVHFPKCCFISSDEPTFLGTAFWLHTVTMEQGWQLQQSSGKRAGPEELPALLKLQCIFRKVSTKRQRFS